MSNVSFSLSMSLDGFVALFDRLGGRVDLERTQVVEAPEGVTHLRFRVIR
jgi:hypothetical protein